MSPSVADDRRKGSPAKAGLSLQEEPSNVTFTIDERQTPQLNSRCDGDHKNALLLVGRNKRGPDAISLDESALSKENEDASHGHHGSGRRTRFFLAPPQPFWRMPMTGLTIMVHSLSARCR